MLAGLGFEGPAPPRLNCTSLALTYLRFEGPALAHSALRHCTSLALACLGFEGPPLAHCARRALLGPGAWVLRAQKMLEPLA